MTVQNYDDNQLKTMGKAAADLSSVSGIPMDRAVTQKLSSFQLNQEQVRRVVEHANIQAFRAKHASMSAPHRVVEFDQGPADPEVVWNQLRASNEFSGASVDLSPSDYASEPAMKVASTPFSAFSTHPDSPEIAVQKLSALYDQLTQAHEILVSERESAGMSMRQELAMLGEHTKSAMAEGVSPTELLMAWDAVSPAYLDAAARAVGLPEDLGKVASQRQINPASSVVQHYAEFTKQAGVYANRNQALLDVENTITELAEAFKEAGVGRFFKGLKRSLTGGPSPISYTKPGMNAKVRQSGRKIMSGEIRGGVKKGVKAVKGLFSGPAAGATGSLAGDAARGVGRGIGSVAKGTAIAGAGVGALGLYGGYKAVKGVGDVVSGAGNAVGNIGGGGQR